VSKGADAAGPGASPLCRYGYSVDPDDALTVFPGQITQAFTGKITITEIGDVMNCQDFLDVLKLTGSLNLNCFFQIAHFDVLVAKERVGGFGFTPVVVLLRDAASRLSADIVDNGNHAFIAPLIAEPQTGKIPYAKLLHILYLCQSSTIFLLIRSLGKG
jgi:hypothetical protein